MRRPFLPCLNHRRHVCPFPLHFENSDIVDWMRLQREFSDDAKIATTASAACPQQIGIIMFVCLDDVSIGIDHSHAEDVVAGQTHFASQQAKTPAESQSGYSYRGARAA